jgi:phosphoglycerol transferase MdoB-like AlkP superfamily enzyme
MKLVDKIPYHVKLLMRQLAFVLVLLTITRLIFHLFNRQAFSDVSLYDYLIGMWFDSITMGLFFLPYIIVFLAPVPMKIRQYRITKSVYATLFLATTVFMVGLNLMDVEYFKYTSKRSTIDLLAILGAGSDFKQLITTFIKDFWYLILFFITGFILAYRFYKRSADKAEQQAKSMDNFIFRSAVYLILFVGLFVFIGRGGFVFKPVGVLDVSRFVNTSKTALVLNTPFTMVKSVGNEGLTEEKFYPSIAATEKYFNPIKQSQPQYVLPDGTNVVILILESFGKEFIGHYSHEKTYTPFLDSLLSESMTFDAAFANGKKSIEAVPSIFASIPSLLDNPYISSQYNSNRIIGLPELLKEHGYESAFYHGATNGSMRFDAFAQYIGFDHYFGKKEYGNEKHSDKTWGILDEYFNPWTAKQITKLKQPFLATLFTLSSHHPFFVPQHRKKDVINGPQPLCASISYGDLSLRLFFEEAKKQPWFENTLFVICADHTPGTATEFYNLRTQLYQIPMALYHPGGKIEKGRSEEVIQQIDIYPTILDLLNINTTFYSFGNSIFDKNNRFSVSYLEGNYFYFENNKMLVFSGNQARNLYDFTSRNKELVDIISDNRKEAGQYEKRLEAIIQRYNHDLIRNKTTAIK